MTEAELEDSGSGLAPVTKGWFVVNVRDAEWWFSERRGAACNFESEYGEPPVEFAQLGINVTVLEPGQHGLYHAESEQEAFLVLSGECRLLVGGEERRLRRWDFFHCPPWTEHAFVGAGDGPCVILMAGARSPDAQGRYPVSKLAARYGASVEDETSDPTQAHATIERFRRERPPYWARLPWAATAIGGT
ncbi:MAG TPA: cupin domain-containing protein [Gaiellaceae bacterium]|nr:cupin domain-containing protein [Gaiellaceae bacterium]